MWILISKYDRLIVQGNNVSGRRAIATLCDWYREPIHKLIWKVNYHPVVPAM